MSSSINSSQNNINTGTNTSSISSSQTSKAKAKAAAASLTLNSISKLNFYELLDINRDSTPSHIRRAYRRRALYVHPDKNKSNPDAGLLKTYYTNI